MYSVNFTNHSDETILTIILSQSTITIDIYITF